MRQRAELAGADAARRFFAEAKEALSGAQEVYTRDKSPDNWSLCRDDLADLLTREGQILGGDLAPRLLREAVAAGREALDAAAGEKIESGEGTPSSPWATLEALGRKQEAESVKAAIAARP